MARGRRGKGTKAKKPAKRGKTPKGVKAASRKPVKRGAAKAKPRKQPAKVPVKHAVAKKTQAKKAAPPKQQQARKAAPPKQQKLEIDVIDVETVEEVAPGVALVTDYELVGVRPATTDKKTGGGTESEGA